MFICVCFGGSYDKDWFVCCVSFFEMVMLSLGQDVFIIGEFICGGDDEVLRDGDGDIVVIEFEIEFISIQEDFVVLVFIVGEDSCMWELLGYLKDIVGVCIICCFEIFFVSLIVNVKGFDQVVILFDCECDVVIGFQSIIEIDVYQCIYDGVIYCFVIGIGYGCDVEVIVIIFDYLMVLYVIGGCVFWSVIVCSCGNVGYVVWMEMVLVQEELEEVQSVWCIVGVGDGFGCCQNVCFFVEMNIDVVIDILLLVIWFWCVGCVMFMVW